jgi:hypothetical protein
MLVLAAVLVAGEVGRAIRVLESISLAVLEKVTVQMDCPFEARAVSVWIFYADSCIPPSSQGFSYSNKVQAMGPFHSARRERGRCP